MTNRDEIRVRNPFHDPLVTELIEDPVRYREMFSEEILVGETLEVFKPTNVALVGPQGSGKSMLLNLVRQKVLAGWIQKKGSPPGPLKHVEPFFGISINLVRANFHAFGRRSVAAALGRQDPDFELDTSCAADFLNHYLLREFIRGIEFLLSNEGTGLKRWLGLDNTKLSTLSIAREIAKWDSWFGYYEKCESLTDLIVRCEYRLSVWRSFLNANIDTVPTAIWTTKSDLGDPFHEMGNLLSSRLGRPGRLPLFVAIDQYEVLPELNKRFGTTLQRIVNTLIKARDPVVFYKIGARTYDWGRELRIWGAESRIEVQRDYTLINLTDVLMLGEDKGGWLFPKLAMDVAHRRVRVEGHYRVKKQKIPQIFGNWTPEKESGTYFRKEVPKRKLLADVPPALQEYILTSSGDAGSPLQFALARAWYLQRRGRGLTDPEIAKEAGDIPWQKQWWRKERTGPALLHIASTANQKRHYFGWKTIIFLSGHNISALLMLCGEIWDIATKMDFHPLKNAPLPTKVQSEGVYTASELWRNRDRNEHIGGSHRYDVISRLGAAVHDAVMNDEAISNPGYTGFSLREDEIGASEEGRKVQEFLKNAVSWGIFEERTHTSKQREAATRKKWYLHPLLSPVFGIPYIRVKEPRYSTVEEVYDWIFRSDQIAFDRRRRKSKKKHISGAEQMQLGGLG